MGGINLIVCNTWFSLNLRNPALEYGEVEGDYPPCDHAEVPSPVQAKELLLQQLVKDGYDVSSFPADVPITPAASVQPAAGPALSALVRGSTPLVCLTGGGDPLIAPALGKRHAILSPPEEPALFRTLARGC
jgi:hypothetical protein